MKTTLYICYFGVRQPLVRTQVIPYLEELSKNDYKIHLLTFEPDFKNGWTGEQLDTERLLLAEKGIAWQCLAYHKRPSALATAWDIFAGTLRVRKIVAQQKINILHGRVHVPTLMGALARKFSSSKPKLVFDIRGFFPEEYTDAGVWPEKGLLYRAAKRVERWLMQESDGFVILTEKARQMVLADESRPVEVIPCCVDLANRFPAELAARRDTMREKLGVAGRTVYTHVGALGGLYLTKELSDFMAAARELDPRAFAMFLTQSDPAEIVRLLRERGYSDSDMFVGRVEPSQIPDYLIASDAGLSFVKATYATQSRSPTKIPEYLAAGLPIIANSGVGDVDELINSEKVGILVDEFTPEAYQQALFKLRRLGYVSERCKETARRRFDLEAVGGSRYFRLYKNLLQS